MQGCFGERWVVSFSKNWIDPSSLSLAGAEISHICEAESYSSKSVWLHESVRSPKVK